MASSFEYVSLLAFAIAWAIHIGVSMIWYSSPFFGDICGRIAFGKRVPPTPTSTAVAVTLVGGGLSSAFFSFLLGVVGCETSIEGALWGLAFGLFFDTGLNAPHVLFEERPVELFAIHRGSHALSLTIIGACLGQLCGHKDI